MASHIYHYNVSSEQRYFLGREHRDLYDLIAFNGNIVSHTPAGIAAFVATANREFYIDPQTHAFQHATINLKRDISDKEKGEPPKYEFKPSIERLAVERLGGPFASVIQEDRPIRPEDFLADNGDIRNDIIEKVCQGVVDFQRKTMIDSLDDEAKEFIGDLSSLQPRFIVAPYFYLSPRRFKQWLEICRDCYLKTREIVTDLPVYLALVISKETLNKEDGDIKDIVEMTSEVKPDGILLWIDEHVEESLMESETERYVDFLRDLRNSVEKIYNIHGGYLSILLCHPEIRDRGLLDGVGHSINYGESRSMIPVGGGIPMARFYFLSVHSRLRFWDALGILLSKKWLTSTDQYCKNVCSCAQCREFIKERESLWEAFSAYGESYPVTFRRRSGTTVRLDYPTKEAKQAAARHYLYNKANEFRELEKKPFGELLEDLKNTYEEIAPYSGDELVAHLHNWQSALKELIS